ncbi:DNA topoisomerase IV [Flavobacterium sp.]|uniref:DNA topoisomerase IV n=1 Tax=Flavobacterium sp. TaxID=239 RepID=UPI00261968FD|nr:DNA topoisomerase IV [Flavobacterium sp.]
MKLKIQLTISNILILLFLISCDKQERNCTDFKTGKFEFSQEIDGKKQTSTFERTEKLQIETFNGKTDTASVRWVNDCEFILQKLHPKNMQEKKAISMKILSTKDKTYIFEYSFVGEAKKQQGTVTKID